MEIEGAIVCLKNSVAIQEKMLANHWSLGGLWIESTYVHTRCGHVVRDFESEAKTMCNFQFR